MDESHLMTNMAPQHPNVNRQAWATLEDGVRDLVKSTGGKAYVLTGNLYLDAQGKPLPPEARETIGKEGRPIAVPTHNFKTVLLELPNGNLSMFAYMVPNVKDAPTNTEDIAPHPRVLAHLGGSHRGAAGAGSVRAAARVGAGEARGGQLGADGLPRGQPVPGGLAAVGPAVPPSGRGRG